MPLNLKKTKATKATSMEVGGCFLVLNNNEASIIKHHINKEFSYLNHEYTLCDSDDAKFKVLFIFRDDFLFTEIKSFVQKMELTTKRFNIKKLKNLNI